MNKYQTMLKKMNRSVTLIGHTHSTRLRELVLAGVLKADGGKKNYRHDWGNDLHPFTDMRSTSTYDRCLHVVLNSETEVIEVEVYEGDSMDGDDQTVYRLEGAWWKYDKLAGEVESCFDDYVERALREEDALAMATRHQHLKRAMLGECNE